MRIAVLVFLLLAGCSMATTKYRVFEAKQTDFEGAGGTKDVVNGVDVWVTGAPPRKFRILGVISDLRPNGVIPQNNKLPELTKATKDQGGDAMILYTSEERFAGTVAVGNVSTFGTSATGTAVSVPAYKSLSRYLVVKYLD